MKDTLTAGVEQTDRGPWISVASRSRFYPLDPQPEEIFISDIASSLSKLCRFNGHIDRFYSVAEHSVYVANHMQRIHGVAGAQWGLLHDASEAYVGDMVRPLKSQDPIYVRVEDKVQEAVIERFSIDPEMVHEVHFSDNVICATEKRDLIPGGEHWSNMPDPDYFEIKQRDVFPAEAEEMFLERFYELFPEWKD